MTARDDNPEGKAVLRYEDKYDDKGRPIRKPIYMKETPSDEIKRMNEMYPDWKNTKQE